ncbi:MAG: diguanylate cyclase [Helicobacteraceae bacterium CG2_30_36_10]|nr:MAG: diguanylate cyclase [Helicobacteraceae bacterium CG2_30_36_10]
MKFPTLSDIATTAVISVSINDTASKAIEQMLKHEHRHVVVVGKNCNYIISVINILNLKEKKISLETPLSDLKLQEIPSINKSKNVLDTVEYLSESVEYICVTNDDGTLYGVLTHIDITSNIDPETLMENYRLQDFLKLGRRMKWVNKDEKISNLISDMVESAYDNVIIVEDLRPIGILTTKDIMLLIKTQTDLNVPVGLHMSKPVESIHKKSSIKEALHFIKKKHYKRVVIVDDEGKLAGIISQKELISLSYSKWVLLMKEYQDELSEINTLLQKQNREYKTMASTDPLTGLYNRRKFSDLYQSSFLTFKQRDNKMSLIILDIDHFKKVNDLTGHNGGDKMLVLVAHTLLKTLRNIDIVCRWGGEEFIALLPTASLEKATILAEKIRVHIQEMEIDVVGHISASFGVAQVSEDDEMQMVINRADKALYLAKESGRNCVKTQKDI